MAVDSLMGITKDLTVAVLPQLSTSGSAEVYGQRIGQLDRSLLKEVELGRTEILTNRGVNRHSSTAMMTNGTGIDK